MATILQLVRREDFGSDIETLDLLSGGFKIANDGWIQAVGNEDDRSVSEVITLRADGSSDNDLSTKLQSLDTKVKQIIWHRDDAEERYGVWLRTKMENESNTRQALIVNARRSPGILLNAPYVRNNSIVREYQLGVNRSPWWEATAHDGPLSMTDPADALGSLTGSITIPGSHQARLSLMDIRDISSPIAISKAWIGARSDRFGVKENLQAWWNLGNSGTFGLNTSAVAPGDGTAKDNLIARCTFVTPSMQPRCTIKVENVTANDTDQRGRFAVILRARTDGSAFAAVRIASGFYSASTWAVKEKIIIPTGSYQLYAMGEVTFPPSDIPASGSDMKESAIRVDAQLLSGSGNLDMNGLCLIPVNEGFMYLSNLQVFDDAGVDKRARVYQLPDDTFAAWNFISSATNKPIGKVDLTIQNPGLPAGSVLFAVAGQNSSLSRLDDRFGLSPTVMRRYATLRGSA